MLENNHSYLSIKIKRKVPQLFERFYNFSSLPHYSKGKKKSSKEKNIQQIEMMIELFSLIKDLRQNNSKSIRIPYKY